VLTADRPFDPFHPDDPEGVEHVPPVEHVIRAPARSSLERVASRAWRWKSERQTRGLESGPSGQRFRRLLHETVFFPDPKRFWIRGALKQGKRLAARDHVDAIMATAYPWSAFVVAERLARAIDVPFFVDFRDAWTTNPRQLWTGPRNRALQAALSERAAAAIAATEGIAQALRARDGDHPPVVTIRNSYDPEEWPEADPTLRDPTRLNVTYTGTFNDALPPSRFDQSPYFLVEAIARLSPDVRAGLRVRIVGRLSRAYKHWIAGRGVGDAIEVVDTVPHRRALQYQLAADVLLCIVSEVQGSAGVLTGKLLEYVGVRRPILALAPEGELASFVRQRGLGWVEHPEGVDKISARLADLVRMHRAHEIPAELPEQPDCAASARSEELARVLEDGCAQAGKSTS
jgi:glycosyltransferase involved in cell wall biosynthesis